MKWLHHLLNPHCQECKEEREAERICNSCETLKYEIERLRSENSRLLSRVLERPEPIIERTEAPQPLTIPSRSRLPWRAKQQMLEAEDREKARILAAAPKPAEGNSIEELEKELEVAGAERESQHTADS